jgi:hypothetical protein
MYTHTHTPSIEVYTTLTHCITIVQHLRFLKPCRPRDGWRDWTGRDGGAGVCAEWGEGVYCQSEGRGVEEGVFPLFF